MSEFENVNFFTDRAVQDDPYPYFDWVRQQGPVWREPQLRHVHHHRPPRGHGDLRRPGDVSARMSGVGDVLVVQRGLRVVREVLGAVRG